MSGLQEFLGLWNKKHAYSAVEDLIKALSLLETPLTEPNEYKITKKEICVAWKWEKWIPSLNRPDKSIRVLLEIELFVNERGLIWSATDGASYRDFIIPETRAFKYLSQLHLNIDQETLIHVRNKITEGLPYKTISMWMRG